ncbi:MAG: hypothetical protein ACXWLH_02390 [Candidatus Saccharimonadales bacterium]
MAVPERAERVSKLLDILGIDESRVVWDNDHNGHLPTWWRAIDLGLQDQPSYVLIFEDDAEPSRDVIAAVNQLIELYPERVFSLYSNSHQVNKARSQNQSLFKSVRTLSDVAMVYPASWLRELKQDYEQRASEFAGKGADEMRVGLRPMLEVWNTVPSLVEHGGFRQSTLGHNRWNQRARWFLGYNDSALQIDWTQT